MAGISYLDYLRFPYTDFLISWVAYKESFSILNDLRDVGPG